ncbi:hypothetical protein BGZ50_008650 [Haplosporangium sp. Z 11]|nr:hypothetical protein BGZ50_008650 [Haplosporangium sp. Z 11]
MQISFVDIQATSELVSRLQTNFSQQGQNTPSFSTAMCEVSSHWQALQLVYAAYQRSCAVAVGSKPNLLFLDLPDPPSSVGVPVPERFGSNILLGVLEKMQTQDLPIFGISGCRKTWSMIEMLCLQWGFHFNAAKNDFGSDDLNRLADFIVTKTLQELTLLFAGPELSLDVSKRKLGHTPNLP